MPDRAPLVVVDLGRTAYGECWDLQRAVAGLRAAGAVSDVLLLTEHNHVYTIGTTGSDDHLLAGDEELRRRGIAVYHNDRGGDITYHGPGQLVGYPILHLDDHYHDLHRYLRDLEDVVIRSLADFGVAAGRNPEYTGVWVGNDKICAIGVKTSRWVTTHGFALNVTPDLSHFGRIIPCGILDKGVTSLRVILGRDVPLPEIADRITAHFADVFHLLPGGIAPDELRKLIERIPTAPRHRDAAVEPAL